MRPRRFGRAGVALAVLALLLLASGPAWAADRRSGDRVVIGADEVVGDDLIVAADTFVLDGTVKGDLLVMAQTIEINGTVEGDLLAAGGALSLAGTVGDDARIAGAVLRLGPQARIGDDLVAAGSSLESVGGSAVGGELVFGGGQALLAGAVGEELVFAGEGVELRGSVGRGVEAYVGSAGAPTWSSGMTFQGVPNPPRVASGLTVAEGARVAGDLTYTSRDRFELPPSAVAGRVTFKEAPQPSAPAAVSPADGLLELLRRYAALLLVGLLLVWLAPRLTRDVTSELESQPLASLGWGFISVLAIALAFLVVPLATVFLAVILGMVKLTGLMGLVIGAGVLALLALVLLTIIAIAYVAQIAVSFELGRLILLRAQPAWVERPYAPLALGLAILVLLTAVPAVGWLFTLAAVLLGLGALWMLGRDTVRHRPIPAPVHARV